ncbi:hypothetical protein C5167_032499 [Papaver somniferum]|uniref:Uncharacterized protein n=1 Tax=Papaver somniferum TaxID=3469 RepID=A0A4Y7KBN7_PAPSO|nr:hypothetical protein C5167_032499 [Papaver somniferum]
MERKNALKQAINSDLDVFAGLEEALRTMKQWMFFDCMRIQAWSRACKHEDIDIRPETVDGDVVEMILGVPRPGSIPVQPDNDVEINAETVTGLNVSQLYVVAYRHGSLLGKPCYQNIV